MVWRAEQHWQAVLPPEVPVDILVTHGPPYGAGDYTRGRHVGDHKLLEAVQNLKSPPSLWVVGHIHNSYGVYTCVPVTSLCDRYRLVVFGHCWPQRGVSSAHT